MGIDTRAEFTDFRSGRHIIAERIAGITEFWEKEFGGVCWYQFDAPPDIRAQADAIFRSAAAVSAAA